MLFTWDVFGDEVTMSSTYDACRALRSASVPEAAKQQLSHAVQDLLKQLFSTVAQQSSPDPSWDKCGCYLLLRALTRSQQFLQDPGLPVLALDAVDTLRWVKQHVLGVQGGLQEAAAAAEAARQAGKLPAQDDKPFLLLTRLVLTATWAPAAVSAAAAESDGTGYYSAISAAVSSAAERSHGDSGGGVKWSDAADIAGPAGVAVAAAAAANGVSDSGRAVAAAGAPPNGSVRDPVLLCELLEWSSTRVKLALQRLFEPSGAALQQLFESGGSKHCLGSWPYVPPTSCLYWCLPVTDVPGFGVPYRCMMTRLCQYRQCGWCDIISVVSVTC